MPKTVRVIISGCVQGVGYRAWTVATAASFSLKGWVRNLRDGTVEAVFSGHEEKVTSMIEACKKGPAAARVDAIEHFECHEAVEDTPLHSKPTA